MRNKGLAMTRIIYQFIIQGGFNVADDTICKSVFKNGEGIKSQYTKKWIELINRIEKNKAVNSVKDSETIYHI